MKYANLGNTGLLVSKLCFGTMTFGDGRGFFKAIGAVGQAAADEMVKTSIESGINFFDTADVYTEGESELILGQSLRNLKIARQHVVIANSSPTASRSCDAKIDPDDHGISRTAANACRPDGCRSVDRAVAESRRYYCRQYARPAAGRASGGSPPSAL